MAHVTPHAHAMRHASQVTQALTQASGTERRIYPHALPPHTMLVPPSLFHPHFSPRTSRQPKVAEKSAVEKISHGWKGKRWCAGRHSLSAFSFPREQGCLHLVALLLRLRE